MNSDSHLLLTIVILIGAMGLGALCYHLGTRPHDKLTPRMMPWKFLSFGFIATALMVLVHLVNLLGFETGGGLPGMR